MTWKCSIIFGEFQGVLSKRQCFGIFQFLLFSYFSLRMSLISKQKKLYSVGGAAKFITETSHSEETPKVPIKTEVQDDYEEDIFIDCTTFMGSSDLKIEESIVTPMNAAVTRKMRKQPEVNNDEHHKLLEEFRAVLHKRKDKSVECPRCFKLLHRDSIKEHINVVHFKQNKFQCEEIGCDYTASRFARLMMHKKSIHKSAIDPKYEKTKPKRQCNVCGAMVKNWRRHVMKVHLAIKNFFCDICSHGTFFKSDMEIHMRIHARKEPKQPQKFFCEMCGLEFEKRFHLNAHVKAKHTAKERIHNCTICEKCKHYCGNNIFIKINPISFAAFFSTENLKKHIESHGAKGNFLSNLLLRQIAVAIIQSYVFAVLSTLYSRYALRVLR
jgi:hypothetical protein